MEQRLCSIPFSMGTIQEKIMRCKVCGARIKTPRGTTRDTQTCGMCRGVSRGATKGTCRYGDNNNQYLLNS